jgi:fatty acid desaturase
MASSPAVAENVAGTAVDSATDAFKGDIPARLSTGVVKDLSTVNQLESIVAIGSEWLLIALAMALYVRFPNPVVLVLVVMWIGARQHALAVLMHEGAHYHLFKNRKLNEVVSEVLLSWPLFVTTRAYRGSHFAHHRHVNTERDPDFMRKQHDEWMFPKSWRALAWLLFKDVAALNTHQQILEATDLSDQKEGNQAGKDYYGILRVSFYGAVAVVLTYFHLWTMFLLLWMLPTLTWLKMILRIRSIAEHFAIDNDHVYTRTRTTLPSLFEKWFVAPRNVNYHLEHHLYPSVPFSRLPALHTLLMKDEGFQSKAHVTATYWGVLRECVGATRAR